MERAKYEKAEKLIDEIDYIKELTQEIDEYYYQKETTNKPSLFWLNKDSLYLIDLIGKDVVSKALQDKLKNLAKQFKEL